ncbi:glycosyl transferase family 1 [Bacillus sp. AFS076308]|uniref:glycosyltransferase family 4 protein n=1 Tax=Bacillus sp. AFS076308 TaxID=2033512 RepID=UPI000BF95793|nr:glycosyltransferase family 4 protein [Bacillus sp. AFS076308]PFN80593.1 glycosyl transferase family 1 [Bacillus sp. AFS076308]
MINILYLHSSAEMYGADKVLLELLKGLDKTKFNPIVILPCDGILVDTLKRENIETEIIPYPILRRQYFNPKGILQYGRDYFKYSKQILNFVKDKNIKLLHINTTAVLEGIYLKKKLNVPLIWHVHEILLRPRMLYKYLSFLVGKYADTTVVVSNSVKNHILNSGLVKREQIKIIYNGVDHKVYRNDFDTIYLHDEFGIPNNALVVGMIGRVNAWKGQGDFLKAVEPILKKHKNVYTVLIGGVFKGQEWRMDELKGKVKAMTNNNRIVVRDFRNDTPQLHNLFDVFVLPSTDPDPLPTVVLEAMATGKPVIGYRHGGICEMVKDGHNGLLAEVRNPEDLAVKIDTLLQSKELRDRMGRNSRERLLEHFSIESYTQNFSNEYKKLTGK